MNILIAINSNYLIPAKVMLTSLFENNKEEEINVYLLHSSLSEKEVYILRKHIEENYNGKLNDIFVDKQNFEGLPINHHFTVETYYRFLAQSILPDNVERILWLDADMIIKKSLKEFYYQDFEENYVVVCESINKNPKELLRKLDLPENSKYFNAGTILFNLKKVRKELKPYDYFEYIEKNREKITWLDQDVLNVLYNKKCKYNNYKIYNMQVFSDEYVDSKRIEDIDRAAILHYIGSVKPWDFKYMNYYDKYYWHYYKLSKEKGNITINRILKYAYRFIKRVKCFF